MPRPAAAAPAPLIPRRSTRTIDTVLGWVVGRALLALAVVLLLSALVTLLDDRRELDSLGIAAVVCAAAGELLRRTSAIPRTVRAASLQGAVLGAWLTAIAVGVVVYRVSGTADTFGNALLESTAGFTTTAFSAILDLEGTPRGILFFRAATQWLGGLGAVIVVIAVLPALGVGAIETGDHDHATSRPLRSARVRSQAQRLATAYLGLSAAGVLLFFVAGMGPFDSLTYAMTTISTGGFGNHRGSISHFDSALVEWVTAGGMILGGASLALLVAAARGRGRAVLRSLELRAYFGALAFGSVVVGYSRLDEGGPLTQVVRTAIFDAASAVSTTGHTIGDRSGLEGGVGVVLVLLAAVGAMSGSAGGGFRIARALALVGTVRREVVRQLRPRSVVVVRVGRTPLDEGIVSHMVGYQVIWCLLAVVGAIGLALTGVDLDGSLTGAVSGLATWGPGLGDFAGARSDLPQAASLVLLPLLLAGRLEIAPLLVGMAALAEAPRRAIRRRLHR